MARKRQANGFIVPVKRGGRIVKYRVRWKTADGKETSQTFEKHEKAEAEAFLHEVRKATASGASALGYSVRYVADTYWEPIVALKSPSHRSTMEGVRRNWIPEKLLSKPIRDVTVADVYEVVHAPILKGRSADTAKKVKQYLAGVFEQAVNNGLCASSPVAAMKIRGSDTSRRVKAVTRDDVPADDQLAVILAAFEPSGWRPFVEFLALTGLRIGEAVALNVGDFDPSTGVLDVTFSMSDRAKRFQNKQSRVRKETKTRKGRRRLQLIDRAAACLEVAGRDPAEPMFTHPTSGTGKRIRPSNFREEVWWPTLKPLGLTYRPHSMRHYAASVMLTSASVVAVAEYLGHEKPSMTLDIYAGVMPIDQTAAMTALSAAAARVDAAVVSKVSESVA